MAHGKPIHAAHSPAAHTSSKTTRANQVLCWACGEPYQNAATLRSCSRCGRPHQSHLRWLLPLLILAAALAAYASSFWGVFLFDDRLHILGERRLEILWPPWQALTRHRPLVDYSLALQYALAGPSPWSYHGVNLAIHVLAALTLFGLVRRTLMLESFRAGFASVTPWLSFFVALIWVVHPFGTQSVTYIIQRAESLMALFYLLTLYCVNRGSTSARPAAWYAAAVAACALGMGSKAVMVTAPVGALLYDRLVLSSSLAEVFRRRWILYAVLALSLGVLFVTGIAQGVLSPAPRPAHVGFGFKGITPLEYLLTQPGVLLHYLRLSLWPNPLCFDYDWPIARTPANIVLPGILVLAAIGAVIYSIRRVPAAGFAGAYFFIVLSPTSSFVPIKDPIFEHRMYLPLAAIVLLAVVGAERLSRSVLTCGFFRANQARVALAVLAVAAASVLATDTFRRNRSFQSEAAMWHDVKTKQPGSERAAENYGTALIAEGRLGEALPALEEAVHITPNSPDVHNGLGFVLVYHGRLPEAIEAFRRALALRPDHARARLNLGNALRDLGRMAEAVEQYRTLLRFHPDHADARLELANALLSYGRSDEAIRLYRQLVSTAPDNVSGWTNLGFALLQSNRLDESRQSFRRALAIDSAASNALNGLAIALYQSGDINAAIETIRRAVQIRPDFADAHFNLAGFLLDARRTEEAVRHYRRAVELAPRQPSYHYELGVALERLGRLAEALEAYHATLRLQPDHPPARAAIQRLTQP